ncbi:MAG: c-type cytochrome [Planctomycetales bacterium]|nr:c-type cytochrome [Planctomycetales bacterium]
MRNLLFVFTVCLALSISRSLAADAVPETSPHDPKLAVGQLDVAEDLQCTLFAAEPMLVNPSAIDVDHRGRVWVCETVNYRRYHENRPEGDRIIILEDTDGDAQADKSTVFYQSADFDSPHGICVVGSPHGRGTRAIVSCGSRIFTLIDDDGDDRADRQEELFTGIEGVQHDHGVHAVMFGPDGRLYFNVGNNGVKLHDKHGEPVRDRAGNLVIDERKPYQEGMVFRSKTDGTDVETLGWNFRNPWMVTVDSFGNLWQSDNDDDGNRGTRINFVMEFGNYGYRNELDGGNWREHRTGWHQEIPLRHWHLNDPGVIPNLLQTGGGSPTGITVYEGRLLPKKYQGQLLHCDPGPNVVRCYRVSPSGAGYQAEPINLVSGTRNPWFRPIDVKVAPDGSLIVSDWYDPGVGGHGMGDAVHGRLFRITSVDSNESYRPLPLDFSTTEGAVKALGNPNLAVRTMAWLKLAELGDAATQALEEVWHSDDPRMRARALWLLGQGSSAKQFIAEALDDSDARLRVVGLRLARQLQLDVLETIYEHLEDPSPEFRRELLIALAQVQSPWAGALWAELAVQYKDSDRWYLEALGIAARGRWDDCLAAWRLKVGENWTSTTGRDIIWRSRGRATPQLLAELIILQSQQGKNGDRYFRAFDFQNEPEKTAALTRLLDHEPDLPAAVIVEALYRVPDFDIAASPRVEQAVHNYLAENRGSLRYFWLLQHYQLNEYTDDLLQLAVQQRGTDSSRSALSVSLQFGADEQLASLLQEADEKVSTEVLQELGQLDDPRGNALLQAIMGDTEYLLPLRVAAATGLSRSGAGQQLLFQQVQSGQVPEELRFTVSNALHAANDPTIRQQIAQLMPLPETGGKKPLAPISELVTLQGDEAQGKQVFETTGTCAKCHQVGDMGKEVGPNLSEIGSKLSREAMFLAILDPSASISHSYEQYVAELDNGTLELGLLVNDTDASITLRNAEGIDKTIDRKHVAELNKSPASLMPADLQRQLTQQQLVDLVDYLMQLKKKS